MTLTKERCIELLKEHDTPRHIFLHSRKVNGVAVFIATKLKEKGEDISIEDVFIASLLHDMKKIHEIEGKCEHHHLSASDFMEEKGFLRIADLIMKHDSKQIVLNDIELKEWEDKIMSYADSRVMFDELTSLEIRIEDAKKRYPHNAEILEKFKSIINPIEKEIFNKLDMSPEELNEESVKPFLIEDDY